MRVSFSEIIDFMANLMASSHGQIVLLTIGVIGILMLRGPSGRI
jgi:hypothetical protein